MKTRKTKAAKESPHSKPENPLMTHSDPNQQRLQLLEQLLRLPAAQLEEVARFLASLPASPLAPTADPRGPSAIVEPDWHHAPVHRISTAGTYIVTGATLGKLHHFRGAERLDLLHGALLKQTKEAGWHLEAWAVFSNHYHFVGHSQPDAVLLKDLIRELHRSTSHEVNQLDQTPGREVWFQYWDTQLTYEASYLARLKYVHHNPVKHGLVAVANQYRWCSAGWFERTATPAQVKTIYRQKIDRVRIEDDFEPV